MEELNEEEKLILDLALGDGYLARNHGYIISFTHSPKQKDFLEIKKELLENTESFIKSTRRKKETIEIKNCISKHKNGKIYNQVNYKLTNVSMLKSVYKLLIVNKRKTITKDIVKNFSVRTLQILMCDDGGEIKSSKTRFSKKLNTLYKYTEPPTYRINTHSFTNEENFLILEWLKESFNIDGRLGNNKGSLIPHFNSKNTKKIFLLIKPFISKIPSMVDKFSYSFEYFK